VTAVRPPIVRGRRAEHARSSREDASQTRPVRPTLERTDPIRSSGVFRPAESAAMSPPTPRQEDPGAVVSEAYRLLDDAVESGRNAAWRRGSQPSGDLSAAVQRFTGSGHSIGGTGPSSDPTQVLQTLAQLAQPVAGIARALTQMHAQNTGVDLGSVWPVPRWDRVDVPPPAPMPSTSAPPARAWEPIEPEDDEESATPYPTDLYVPDRAQDSSYISRSSTSKMEDWPGAAAERDKA